MPERNGTDVRRALIQHLEGLRRAGLTHVPRAGQVAVVEAPTLSPVKDEAPADAAPASLAIEAAGAALQASAVACDKRAQRPMEADLFGSTAVPQATTGELSLEDRRARLAALSACVARCTRCAELAETRTQTVFGVGNPQARILFVGEAPGADEDRQGEPFVGRAGQLLNRIIVACRLTREEVYICNVLKCRPPGNRTPLPQEADNCREYLDGQIATIAPEYIVCWGSVAAQRLLDTAAPIGRLRGKFYSHAGAKVLCTYHPSYLLRNPAAKAQVWDDMKFLMRDLGVDLDAK
jgi:DNA polymerase